MFFLLQWKIGFYVDADGWGAYLWKYNFFMYWLSLPFYIFKISLKYR